MACPGTWDNSHCKTCIKAAIMSESWRDKLSLYNRRLPMNVDTLCKSNGNEMKPKGLTAKQPPKSVRRNNFSRNNKSAKNKFFAALNCLAVHPEFVLCPGTIENFLTLASKTFTNIAMQCIIEEWTICSCVIKATLPSAHNALPPHTEADVDGVLPSMEHPDSADRETCMFNKYTMQSLLLIRTQTIGLAKVDMQRVGHCWCVYTLRCPSCVFCPAFMQQAGYLYSLPHPTLRYLEKLDMSETCSYGLLPFFAMTGVCTSARACILV